MSIGDSNVVDGADVNPPSADAGPDPCVSNHDVLPVVPVVCHAKIIPGENCTGRYIFGYQICTAPVHVWSPKVYRPCQKCTAPVQFW